MESMKAMGMKGSFCNVFSFAQEQCSQRGSPSVLGLDGGGRRLAVPSGLFQNLPCAPARRTISPAVPRRPP